MPAAPRKLRGAWDFLEAFALQALALHLAGPANRFGGLTGAALGRLLEMPPQLHFTENTLPLHLLLERLQRLVDIVVANENLHLVAYSSNPTLHCGCAKNRPSPGGEKSPPPGSRCGE